MSDLAERIREAAKVVGGLNRLAELADIKRRTLGNWLEGRKVPAEALTKIADVTGVNVEWLATGEGLKLDGEATFQRAMAKVRASSLGLSLTDFEAADQADELRNAFLTIDSKDRRDRVYKILMGIIEDARHR